MTIDVPQSFVFIAGETLELDFTADDDITGATVRFWAARAPGGTAVLTTEGPTANAVGTVTASPVFRIVASDESTENLIGDYIYEVELEDVSGNKTKAARGYLTFRKQVEA